MDVESAFFSDRSALAPSDAAVWDVVHESRSGCCILYRGIRYGKFVIAKGLKSDFRNNPEYVLMLKKEFEIAYNLDHPNICRTLSFEAIDSLGDCIIMEWVDGCTLSEYIRRRPDQVKSVALQICDALEYLHDRQTVHRDLKPDNVLVTSSGGNVKLIDFGFSDTDSYCICKGPAGTMHYASPEQIAGRPLDGRSDIYSLGVILREFGGKDFAAIAKRCTMENPDDRYENIAALRRDIERLGSSRRLLYVTLAVLLAAALLGALAFFSSPVHDNLPDAEQQFDQATQAIIDSQTTAL